MARVLVNDTTLTGIANAIRQKNGLDIQYKPSDMAKAISDTSVETPTGSTTITENGTYDVSEFAQAIVNVASSSDLSIATGKVTPSDEKLTSMVIDTGLQEVHGFAMAVVDGEIYSEYAYKKLLAYCLFEELLGAFGHSTNNAGSSRSAIGWVPTTGTLPFSYDGSEVTYTYSSAWGYLIPKEYKWVAW